jgi:hypothetical protein
MQTEQQSWQSVNRLLLACTFDEDIAEKQLGRFVNELRRTLPVQVGQLFIQEQGYLFYSSRLNLESSNFYLDWHDVMRAITPEKFDAAIIFTQPSQSPYSLAYFFYLAGIPIRVGQSCEFGGRLLSQTVKPLLNLSSLSDHHQHLLNSVGLLTSVLT